jgi:transposase
LAHEVFAGNRHDSTTLEEMLKSLDQRVGLRPEQMVVVDRGMAGKANVEQIRARGLHYLVAEPYAERKDWVAEFQDGGEFAAVEREPSPRNPFQKKSTIQVKMRRVDGETHVLCLSSERKEKDRAIRELHEKRLLADLEKLKKRAAKGKGRGTKPAEVRESIGRLKERYSRVARYYRMEYEETKKTFEYHLEESKRAEAEKLDGSYLLKTDREDFTADEAWRIYILLTRAEAAFRALKSPLAERPIFHHKQCRVEAHIFLCVLAYHLLTAIEKTLLDAGAHTSWATVREQLQTHQVNTIILPTDGGIELRIRKATTPEPVHQELYRQLGIAAEIMHPQRRVVPAEEVPK